MLIADFKNLNISVKYFQLAPETSLVCFDLQNETLFSGALLVSVLMYKVDGSMDEISQQFSRLQ